MVDQNAEQSNKRHPKYENITFQKGPTPSRDSNCTICLEALEVNEETLVHSDGQCLNAWHTLCLEAELEASELRSGKVRCPHCRVELKDQTTFEGIKMFWDPNNWIVNSDFWSGSQSARSFRRDIHRRWIRLWNLPTPVAVEMLWFQWRVDEVVQDMADPLQASLITYLLHEQMRDAFNTAVMLALSQDVEAVIASGDPEQQDGMIHTLRLQGRIFRQEATDILNVAQAVIENGNSD